MLALLALSDPPELSRERLTGLFWSESEQSRANATLRQAVHEARVALRAAGCDVLVATRLNLALRPASFSVDCIETIAAIEARASAPLGSLLSADLFQGFEDLDPAFGDWLVGWCGSMHTRFLRTLEAGFRDAGTPRGQRKAWADAALALEPTHEEACRIVMRAVAEAGETAAALRAYDTLYRLLDSEFDMEPSAATQELVAEIKQGKFDPAPPPPAEQTFRFAAAVRAGPPWVAVMPFRTHGPDQMPPWLMEGLVDDIVRMLAGLREPVVISSNSTRMFRDQPIDAHAIRQMLGVQYIVTGTARTAGRALRLSVELSDTDSGEVLWADAYDTQDTVMFETQDRIVERIVNRIAPRVHEAELRRIRIQQPRILSAYHLTLEAKDMIFGLEEDTFSQAGLLLRQAIALEPGYAAAHGALASWYSLRLGQGWSPDRGADAAELHRHVSHALRLDGAMARTHARWPCWAIAKGCSSSVIRTASRCPTRQWPSRRMTPRSGC
jgi:TolB-like protein